MKPLSRPFSLSGETYKYKTGCGNLFITVNIDDEDNPIEVFAHMGKVGGCSSAHLESLSRVLSIALRAGVDADEFIKMLSGIKCPSGAWNAGRRIESCSDGFAAALQEAKQPSPKVAYVKVTEVGSIKDLPGAPAGSTVCDDCGHELPDVFYSSAVEGPYYCESCWPKHNPQFHNSVEQEDDGEL